MCVAQCILILINHPSPHFKKRRRRKRRKQFHNREGIFYSQADGADNVGTTRGFETLCGLKDRQKNRQTFIAGRHAGSIRSVAESGVTLRAMGQV